MQMNPRVRITFLSLIAAATLLQLSAGCQTTVPVQRAPSVRLEIGDSLETITQALHIPGPPSPRPSSYHTWDLSLTDRGMEVFFDVENRASQFRFDAPFTADIHGARIGASLDQTRAALGDPVGDWPDSFRRIYLYRPSPDLSVSCIFGPDRKLESIRVVAGSVTLPEANVGIATNSVEYHQILHPDLLPRLRQGPQRRSLPPPPQPRTGASGTTP